MKQIIQFSIIILFSFNAYSQSQDVNRNVLSTKEFNVTYDTAEMKDFKVVLIVYRPTSKSFGENIGTKVWVQRINRAGKRTEKFLGELDTEYGIYIPNHQPIDNAYIIVSCSEYKGEINLIFGDGDFEVLQGYYYATDAEFLYTRQAGQEDLVCGYDFKNRKRIDVNISNLSAKNLSFQRIENSFWIK